MEPYLQTARMTLRAVTPADEDDLYALSSDLRVMRFLGPPATRAEVREQLARWLDLARERPGFGYWPAIETATGAFLGWFLFRPPWVNPPPGTVELGYRLHVAAWGRGLATEGARALVAKGFTELGVRRVVADTMAVNAGSRGVMAKAGLRYVRTYREDGHDEVEYAVDREEWLRGRGGS